MDDECIHGLEGGLCALCFPKAAPVVAPVAAPVKKRVSRPPLTSLVTPRRTAPKATAAARSAAPVKERPVDDVGEQRIYHVTHVNNLAAILASGSLLADTNEALAARPPVDISSAPGRDARRSILVDGDGSLAVSDYVPFFLSPNASVWNSIRSHADDPRLALDAHGSDPFDFVILVSTVKKVTDWQYADEDGRRIAVADGDAAATGTRFAAFSDGNRRMLVGLRANPDEDVILDAEYLVAGAFPLELLSLIGVAHDKVRDSVKEILAASTHRTKVAVYPPWFQPAEVPAV